MPSDSPLFTADQALSNEATGAGAQNINHSSQPFPISTTAGGAPSNFMEISMMSMAQNATLNTLLMSQLVPLLGQNRPALFGGSSTGAVPLSHPSSTDVPPLSHLSSSRQPDSSPLAPRSYTLMSFDDFILQNDLDDICDKIFKIGYKPGQPVRNLVDDPRYKEMIFGEKEAGFKLMEWMRFAQAAEAAWRTLKGHP